MPDKKKQLVNPSPSFEERMQLAQENIRKEYPSEMAYATIKPAGMVSGLMHGVLGKILGDSPVATTGPFGGVTYDPKAFQAMKQEELQDSLAHEMTHVRQFQEMPLWRKLAATFLPQADEGLPEETKKAYSMQGWNPAYRGKSTEMEAYQVEEQRRAKRGEMNPYDIYLPAPRKKQANAGPSSSVLKQMEK